MLKSLNQELVDRIGESLSSLADQWSLVVTPETVDSFLLRFIELMRIEETNSQGHHYVFKTPVAICDQLAIEGFLSQSAHPEDVVKRVKDALSALVGKFRESGCLSQLSIREQKALTVFVRHSEVEPYFERRFHHIPVNVSGKRTRWSPGGKPAIDLGQG